ncbi:SprT-like domain-containing protein [Luteolibacter sp. AS25]|uniref:SprT family zinc-dependent metalloprotease n=1 Tax=Luteolibacter sp. AS25 TaxID=3135776 RepID=UPI00398AD669
MRKPFPQFEFLFPPRKPKSEPSHTKEGYPIDPDLTDWSRKATEQLDLPKLSVQITACWNPRMRTTAGRAWWPACQIELNPKLREISEQEIWRTLKHELAHLIAYHRAGRKRIQPHGTEWKTACADLGIAGETARHTLPFTGRKQKRRYAYTCPVCSSTIQRVRPFRRAVACHTCCKAKNGGQYHDQFRLVRKTL